MRKYRIVVAFLALLLAGTVFSVTEKSGDTDRQVFQEHLVKGVTEHTEYGIPTPFDSVQIIEEAMNQVTYSLLSPYNPNNVIASLYLPDKSENGISISWRSNNKNVITNSGRVIRPRFTEPDANVTLTATFTHEGQSQVKNFDFTVPADQPWLDPSSRPGNPGKHMTDEEFFGVWNGTKWTTEGKLDFTNPKLQGVCNAVKVNDYIKAKEELLAYMRTRNVTPTINLASRNTVYANATLADIQATSVTTYITGGDGVVSSTEYKPVSIDIKRAITRGGSNTYSLIAVHNESTEALIASHRHPNREYWPKIEMTVNGELRTFEAVADATLRAGQYSYTSYADDQDLIVKTFGDFMGDEVYKAVFRFDFSSLKLNDSVSNVRLVVHSRLKQSFAEPKTLFGLMERTDDWQESDIFWHYLTGYVYNWNGIPTGNTWENVFGANSEYQWQVTRFRPWPVIGAEYNYTKDEKYAYYMIGSMMDFITKKGGVLPASSGWLRPADGYPDANIRGGYTRSLDTRSRMEEWASCLKILMGSEYMTPDAATAILKHMWDGVNNLMYRGSRVDGNWPISEKSSVVKVGLMLPEFAKAQDWITDGDAAVFELFKNNFLPDGSFVEATGGYNVSVFETYLEHKVLMTSFGMKLAEGFDEMLKNAAMYNLLLRHPNGSSLQWGDSGPPGGRNTSQSYPELVTWYGDRTFEFLDTAGRSGTQPPWTSYQFPHGKQTMMRSSWNLNALFMYTHVRGLGGAHSHPDDNGVWVMAYERPLLTDSGRFERDGGSELNQWGKSTLAHNTVEINGESQMPGGSMTGWTPENARMGDIHDWVTNDNYDFLSQTTKLYTDVAHRRTIVFLKPYFWIVSDLMTPSDPSAMNSYKQSWHMLPAAEMSTDPIEKKIFSNYNSGANIILGTPDINNENVKLVEEMTLYDNAVATIPNLTAYYQRSARGSTTFDTILLPESGNKGKLDVERINMGGLDTSTATAMKFKATAEGVTHQIYYYLEHNYDPAVARTFEKYRTNGKMALIREDITGNIREISLVGGNRISFADGTDILYADSIIDDISVRISGNTLIVQTEKSMEELNTIYVTLKNANIKIVEHNGKTVRFTKVADGIAISNEPIDVPITIEPNPPTIGPGGNTGSGGKNGEQVVVPVTPDPNTSEPMADDTEFVDVEEHWAKEYIQKLKEKGVIKGSDDGRFYPDNQITRAELLAMVIRGIGLQEEAYLGEFDDVSAEDWYSGAISAGLKAGFISKDAVFRPNDNITREEMSKIIIGAVSFLTDMNSLESQGYELSYTDNAAISDWAVDSVRWASFLKLMQGMEDGSFAPFQNATRAQSTAVISRLLELL